MTALEGLRDVARVTRLGRTISWTSRWRGVLPRSFRLGSQAMDRDGRAAPPRLAEAAKPSSRDANSNATLSAGICRNRGASDLTALRAARNAPTRLSTGRSDRPRPRRNCDDGRPRAGAGRIRAHRARSRCSGRGRRALDETALDQACPSALSHSAGPLIWPRLQPLRSRSSVTGRPIASPRAFSSSKIFGRRVGVERQVLDPDALAGTPPAAPDRQCRWRSGTTAKSSPPSAACSRSSAGISCRQGTHQVAQRLTSATLPLKSASVFGAPSASREGEVGELFRRLGDAESRDLAADQRIERRRLRDAPAGIRPQPTPLPCRPSVTYTPRRATAATTQRQRARALQTRRLRLFGHQAAPREGP